MSDDADLSAKTGNLNGVASGLPGQLLTNGNYWILEEGNKLEMSVMIPTRQWFKSTDTDIPKKHDVGDFITWADEVVKARMIGTTLVYFGHEQAAVPYMKGQEGVTLNLPRCGID